MARHKKEQQNYSVSQGQFAKSSEQHPWRAAGTVARVPSVLGHGRARGVGETKEERKGFRLMAYPRRGLTTAAGLKAGRGGGGSVRRGDLMAVARAGFGATLCDGAGTRARGAGVQS